MSLHPYLNRSKPTAINIKISGEKAKNSALQGQDKGKINLRYVDKMGFFLFIYPLGMARLRIKNYG
jgi:hypothetical protein